MTPLDLSSIYTITLFRTTTTLTVLYCGMHMQHPKVCMDMISSALSHYLWGKEPISTNTCQHRNTCLCQRHTSPIKHRLVLVHIK